MERDEPALVPQWYKSASGNTSNNGLRTSTFRRSDGNSIEHGSKNRLLEDTDKNLRRSLSSNCSTNRDRGSSSRSQAYSSFRRSRDRNQDKDFDSRDRDTRSSLFHSNGFDYLDPFLGAAAEKDALRRSQSMIAERPPKKLGNSANNSAPPRGTNIASISKTSFEKEFPSLRAEERQGLSDTASATLHGPRTAVQSLPLAAPVIIGTSALAEVPLQVETNGTINSPIVKAPSISQASTAGGSTMAGLNMAEALTQTPSQVGDVSQLSFNTHRIEELTLRKCKQLIPVTPSMPKTLSSNSSEKTKSKVTRGGDFTSHNKVHQQAHQNPNVRPPTGSDGAKTTQGGNFQVLNREKNGIRDGKSVINPTSLVPSAGVPSLKSPTDQKHRVEKNGGERKLTSHAQNRNDFFNLLRKKSLARSSVTPEPCSLDRSLNLEKSDAEDLLMSSPVNLRRKNGNCLAGDLFASDGSERYYAGNGETNPYLDIVVDPEEEAFLQSLGWDKNAWEEALTKEEIDAFLKKYEKQVPLKIVPEYVGGSQISGSDA